MAAIISVTVRNNVTSKTVTTPSTTSIRQIFEDNGVEYTSGVVSLDGASLPAGSMDKSLEELGITADHCYLMVTVKADNASDEPAKIVIIGETVHVISSQKLEDIKLLEKYRPNALILTDGEGSDKREVFHVFTGGRDGGSIARNGIIFSTATTAEGFAVVTMTAPEGTDDVKSWAEGEIGVAILNLRKVEAQFASAIDDVKAEKAAVAATIVIG